MATDDSMSSTALDGSIKHGLSTFVDGPVTLGILQDVIYKVQSMDGWDAVIQIIPAEQATPPCLLGGFFVRAEWETRL